MIPAIGSRSVDICFLIACAVESIWSRVIKFCIYICLVRFFYKRPYPHGKADCSWDYIRNHKWSFSKVEKIRLLCYPTLIHETFHWQRSKRTIFRDSWFDGNLPGIDPPPPKTRIYRYSNLGVDAAWHIFLCNFFINTGVICYKFSL